MITTLYKYLNIFVGNKLVHDSFFLFAINLCTILPVRMKSNQYLLKVTNSLEINTFVIVITTAEEVPEIIVSFVIENMYLTCDMV